MAMKLRAKANKHVRHPNPFLRRRRQKRQALLLVERVTNQTDARTLVERPRMRLLAKRYVGSPTDRIDQWQLQTTRGNLTVSRAAYGWTDTPFLLYTKGRLMLGKFAFHIDRP